MTQGQVLQPALPQGIESKCVDDIVTFIEKYKVKVVVETGVCYGVSSNAILSAIPDDGLLVSIENAPYQIKSLIVMEQYYKKWLFVYGDSRDVLPNIMRLVKNVDLFWHDSLHKKSAMRFEYETALPHTRFIGSHDINHPGAQGVWDEFLSAHNMKERVRRGKWAIAQNLDWKEQ